MPTFNNSEEKKAFENIAGKEKMLVTTISSFPNMFSTLSKNEFLFFLITFTCILSSANAFNLDKCKVLASDKEVNFHLHSLLIWTNSDFCDMVKVYPFTN